MREIKFRAWNEVEKKMIYDGGDDTQATWILHNCDYKPFGIWELMQYTGLNDKNGKEIYEGDVIEMYSDACLYSVGGVIEKRVVSWDKTRNGWNFLESRNYKCQIHSDEELSDTLEIIGNIYENPELKEKK